MGIVQNLVQRADSWVNAMTGLGTLRDKLTHAQVVPGVKADDGTLEALFNDDDVARRIVSKLPREATRRGFRIVLEGDDEGDDAEEESADVEREMLDRFQKLDAMPKLRDSWIWARLYGGGSGVFVGADDGQAVDQPLDETKIRSISFLNVIKRPQLSIARRYTDLTAPRFGEPEIYNVHRAQSVSLAPREGIDVHESRLILFDGAMTARSTMDSASGFDDSVLQSAMASLQQNATAWQSVAHLLTDASQGVLKIANLVDLVAAGGEETLRARVQLMDMARSVCRSILVDAERESFERIATSFAGLPEVMDRLMMRMSSAADGMPVTLLFGRSPAGLNATGESDIRSWYDTVAEGQSDEFKPRLERLLRLMFAAKDSPTRGRTPDNWCIEFNPLWQPTDRELADTKKVKAETYVALVGAQIMTDAEAGIGLAPDFPTIDVESRTELAEADKDEGLRPREVNAPPPPELGPGDDDDDGGDDDGGGGSEGDGPKGRQDDQTRVPAGSPQGGQWTSSRAGASAIGRRARLVGPRERLKAAQAAHGAAPSGQTASAVALAHAELREERRAIGQSRERIADRDFNGEKRLLRQLRDEDSPHREEQEEQVLRLARARGSQVEIAETITQIHADNVAEPVLRRHRQSLVDDVDVRGEYDEGPRGDRQHQQRATRRVKEAVDEERTAALDRLRSSAPDESRASVKLIHDAAKARIRATHAEAVARLKQIEAEVVPPPAPRKRKTDASRDDSGQPRVPAGSSTGGQFASTGASGGGASAAGPGGWVKSAGEGFAVDEYTHPSGAKKVKIKTRTGRTKEWQLVMPDGTVHSLGKRPTIQSSAKVFAQASLAHEQSIKAQLTAVKTKLASLETGPAKAVKALGDASSGALADVPGREAVRAAMPGVEKATQWRKAAEAELVQNPDNKAAWKVTARGLAADAVKVNAGKAVSEEALANVERWSSKAYQGHAAAMANEAHAALRTPGSWAQHHYAATQGVIEKHVLPRLRAEGKVDADGNVTLYRGVRDKQAGAVFEASQRGEAVDLQVNKLSSWSESADVARSFGTVVEAKVHYTKAFITHHAQGRTWADEQEWAVLSDGVEKVKVHGR